jgi:hypothetical protein
MPRPVLQSLILADHVYEDKLTGKRIIAGVFNRIIRGVRVIKQMGPPMQPQAPAPQYIPPPVQNLSPPTPPPAPLSPDDFSAPPQYASPSMPEVAPSAPSSPPPAPPSPPPAISPATPAPAHESPPPVAHVQPPAQPAAPTPAPYRHPELPAPEQAPAAPPAHPVPAHSAAHQPPQPLNPNNLQPGQRVLEIPPTGLQSGSPFAYLSLTEVRGAMSFILQLVNLEDDSQLFRSDLRVECHNPLLTVEMTVPLPPISPPQAGIYALELMWNNEILGSLRIIVEDAAQQ